jgi:hypothetical protein
LINANGEAWVLGNIQDTTYVDYNGSYALTVKLQPIAVLKPAEEGEILVTHKALAATKGVN